MLHGNLFLEMYKFVAILQKLQFQSNIIINTS